MRGQGTLLWCGILSSILYVAADAAGALASPGYDSVAQAISELTAIGAPTRPLLVAPFVGYDALVIAFGVGVMRAACGRALALCGALLLAVGGIGLVATSLFPMHSRGSTTSLTDTMHIVLTALTVLCIAGAVLCAAVAQGHRFAGASIAALIVMLGAGALAAAQGADLAGGLPTPSLGLFERLSIGTWLLWVGGLALALLRRQRRHGAESDATPPSLPGSVAGRERGIPASRFPRRLTR